MEFGIEKLNSDVIFFLLKERCANFSLKISFTICQASKFHKPKFISNSEFFVTNFIFFCYKNWGEPLFKFIHFTPCKYKPLISQFSTEIYKNIKIGANIFP